MHHQDDEAGSHTPVNAHSVRSGMEMSPAGWGQGMGPPGVCGGDYTGCRWAVARGTGPSGYCHHARMHKQISPKYSS